MNWPRILTEPDNVTPCPVRLGAVGVFGFYHFGAAYILGVQHTQIGFAELGMYAQHMAMLIGTFGGALGAKSILKGDSQS